MNKIALIPFGFAHSCKKVKREITYANILSA